MMVTMSSIGLSVVVAGILEHFQDLVFGLLGLHRLQRPLHFRSAASVAAVCSSASRSSKTSSSCRAACSRFDLRLQRPQVAQRLVDRALPQVEVETGPQARLHDLIQRRLLGVGIDRGCRWAAAAA